MTTRLLYPFHHVEVDDYWDGVYGGWRAVLAELLGTFMYVFASAGVAIATNTYLYMQCSFYFLSFLMFSFLFLRHFLVFFHKILTIFSPIASFLHI